MDSVDGRGSAATLLLLLSSDSESFPSSYLAMAIAVSDSNASIIDPRMDDSFHTLIGFSPVILFSECMRCSTVDLARYLFKASTGVNCSEDSSLNFPERASRGERMSALR